MCISRDLFLDEWVNSTEIPPYTPSRKAEPDTGGRYRLHLRVRQEDAPDAFIMPVPLEIQFADSTHALVRVNVHGPFVEAAIQVPAEPTKLTLNPLESVLAEIRTESWR